MLNTKLYNTFANNYKRLSEGIEKIIFKPNTIAKRFNLPSNIIYLWGKKRSGLFRELIARLNSRKIVFMEDGFIRSINYGNIDDPISICVDKKSIYYDYNFSNDLEDYIIRDLDNNSLERAKKLKSNWVKNRISKYNCKSESEPPNESFILIVDQTVGDKSIHYGGASKKSFTKMLSWAYDKWPKHTILIKTHPDVIHKNKSAHFSKRDLDKKRIKISGDGGHPTKLLEKCDAVCVVTSQLGFEALLWDKPVYVFGWPFYAGWGLTKDYLGKINRRIKHKIKIEQLIYSVIVDYSIYKHPETSQLCQPEEIIDWIKFQRDEIKKIPDNAIAIGFTPWKAKQIKRYIPNIKFKNKISSEIKKNKNILVWGNSVTQRDEYHNNSIVRVEDGFIRSVGLGGNLIEASSLIFDKRSIYYDSSKYSDLEHILNNTKINKTEIIRAKELLNNIISLKLTKYNISGKNWISSTKNKNIILVLGQVEKDASIRFGVPKESITKSNLDLVKNTRNYFPNSWIIYKPHPDVHTGLRRAGIDEYKVKNYCDEIVGNVNIENLYESVDRISVLTSLGGFEGLIRGIPVTTWGIPFYAGWGLTDDKLKHHKWIKSKRKKELSLLELIHGCLIEYPKYSSCMTRKLCTPEQALKELSLIKNKKINLNLTQKIFRYWGPIKNKLLGR
tara:strand:- start:718 stop:2733 length:2016 start_codon:yes stop_codon:yes gene_type:complete